MSFFTANSIGILTRSYVAIPSTPNEFYFNFSRINQMVNGTLKPSLQSQIAKMLTPGQKLEPRHIGKDS